jgi:hypothetical protein
MSGFNIRINEDLAALLDGSDIMLRAAEGVEVLQDIDSPAVVAVMRELHRDAIEALQAFIAMEDPGANIRATREAHYRLWRAVQFGTYLKAKIVDGLHAEETIAQQDGNADERNSDITQRGGTVRDPAPDVTD